MFPIPWFVVTLVSIPEAYLVVILGFALFNLRISYKQALLAALGASLACYLVRLVNKIDGVHTITEVLITIAICVCLTRTDIHKITAAILAGMSLAGIIQYSYTPLFLSHIIASSVNDFTRYPWLCVYLFIPQAVIMTVLYLAVKKTHFYILDGRGRGL